MDFKELLKLSANLKEQIGLQFQILEKSVDTMNKNSTEENKKEIEKASSIITSSLEMLKNGKTEEAINLVKNLQNEYKNNK